MNSSNRREEFDREILFPLYLFLLVAEGLSCLLKSSSQSSLLEIKVAPSAPTIKHLLFADDNLLLFKSSIEGANLVSNLLDVYCVASGQRVNHDKSSIFFSKGCLMLSSRR